MDNVIKVLKNKVVEYKEYAATNKRLGYKSMMYLQLKFVKELENAINILKEHK